jgi:hypothetical protein
MEVTRPCFRAGGKYSIQKIVFTNMTRKDTTLSGGCFRSLSDITFGPGVSRTDRQYTVSPHRCDVLLSPTNHRVASQVVASHNWRGFPST